MKNYHFLKFLTFIFLLLSQASFEASASSEIRGQRVVLCGALEKQTEKQFVQISAHLPAVQITGLELNNQNLTSQEQLCFVGSQLPLKNEANVYQFEAKRVLEHQDYKSFLAVCGPLSSDEHGVYIHYGTSLESKIYLTPNSKHRWPKKMRKRGSWCAFSEKPPTLKDDQRFFLEIFALQHEWERSGFSVGNL